MKINFELFDKYMKHIQATRDLDRSLSDCIGAYNAAAGDVADIWYPSAMETDLVDLLSIIMDDEELISYWVYDLDCGREYEEGCCEDENGNPVPLRTTVDLWTALH